MNLKSLVAVAAATFATVAVATLAPADASASNYPPDYPVCSSSDTLHTGPFELIRNTTNPWGHHAKLTIAYRGYLRSFFPDDQINFYVKLNGNDAFVDASAGSNDDAYVLFTAGPRDCAMCIDYQAPPGSACAQYIAGGGSSGSWLCNAETPTEQNLFYWAFNNNGQQNAWDIEVAAEANGWWDSNYGYNYRARFEPRTTCY